MAQALTAMRRLGHLLIVLLLCRPALADAPARTSDAELAARAHFELGQRQYQRGQFSLAIVEFKAAYAHAHLPALLFNTAQAYRALHDRRQALAYFEAYLRVAPDGRERAFAQARVVELRRLARPASPARMGRPAPPISRTPISLPGNGHPGRGLRIAGIITGALGGALLVTGGYFSLRDAKHDQRVATGLYLTGGAAVVAGGILYLLGRRAGSQERVMVAPDRGGVRVAWSGKF